MALSMHMTVQGVEAGAQSLVAEAAAEAAEMWTGAGAVQMLVWAGFLRQGMSVASCLPDCGMRASYRGEVETEAPRAASEVVREQHWHSPGPADWVLAVSCREWAIYMAAAPQTWVRNPFRHPGPLGFWGAAGGRDVMDEEAAPVSLEEVEGAGGHMPLHREAVAEQQTWVLVVEEEILSGAAREERASVSGWGRTRSPSSCWRRGPAEAGEAEVLSLTLWRNL